MKPQYKSTFLAILMIGCLSVTNIAFGKIDFPYATAEALKTEKNLEESLLNQIKKAMISDGLATDQLGWSVAMAGDTAIIGANSATVGANNNQGAAYIFEQNLGGTNNWGLIKKLTASDGAAFAGFGTSVAISGDTIIVGTPFAQIGVNVDQGAAYIFDRNAGGANNWGEIKKLTGGNDPSDQFGFSVAISGDTAIVSTPVDAPAANGAQGSVYIFDRNNGGTNNWGQVKIIFAADGQSSDNFGGSISISGDTIVVGVPLDTVNGLFQQGSAYVFERNFGGANNWGQIKQLLYPEGFVVDYFGRSVSISGDSIIVGIPRAQVGATFVQGAAYIFGRDVGGINNWGVVKKLTASDGVSEDFFGNSVSISGDLAIVGVSLKNVGVNADQGAAYIFERNTGGANNWGETQKIFAADGAAFDRFGNSVAISPNTAVVGTPGGNVGANDNQGSAYFFGNLTPTAAAASIKGRITDSFGQPVARVRISLTDFNGNIRYARTNPFGYYRFEELETGQNYVLEAKAKALQFQNNPRILSLTEDLADENFLVVGLAEKN